MTYDGNNPVSWHDVPWMPNVLRRALTAEKIIDLHAVTHEITASQRQQLIHRGYQVANPDINKAQLLTTAERSNLQQATRKKWCGKAGWIYW